MKTDTKLSWSVYSEKYDMILGYNTYYQQLRNRILNLVNDWEISADDIIGDFGAGTGNFSIPLAQKFPEASILHIDRDSGMNQRAKWKADQAETDNWQMLTMDIAEVKFQPESLAGIISVHALYAFPDPESVLRRMYRWLEPGKLALLADAGRIVNVLAWQLAIGWDLVRKHGLPKTLEILREGKEVSRQNAYIRKLQREGKFWLHSHEEFCEAVEKAGFTILDSSTGFRGITDIVVATK